MSDLGTKLRRLTEAEPVTVEEIIDRASKTSPRRTTARRGTVGFGAAIAAAAVTFGALGLTRTASSHHSVSVEVPSGTNPLNMLPATPHGMLPGCTFVNPSTPITGPGLSPIPAYWNCPATSANAVRAIGQALPDPSPLPSGWTLATSTLLCDISDNTCRYSRIWSANGRYRVGAVGQHAIGLWVENAKPGGFMPNPPSTHLSNGAAVGVSPDGDLLTWTHAGLDYSLTGSNTSETTLMTLANSLP